MCLAAPPILQPAAPGGASPQTGDRESHGLQLYLDGGRDGTHLCTVFWALSLQCQLSGLWRNEQDSLMEISAVRDNGDFQGKYLTRVTLTGSCAYISPLKGAQQQPTDGVWPTFAFTVHWDKFSSKCWDTQG